jgi:hypothetical protein
MIHFLYNGKRLIISSTMGCNCYAFLTAGRSSYVACFGEAKEKPRNPTSLILLPCYTTQTAILCVFWGKKKLILKQQTINESCLLIVNSLYGLWTVCMDYPACSLRWNATVCFNISVATNISGTRRSTRKEVKYSWHEGNILGRVKPFVTRGLLVMA